MDEDYLLGRELGQEQDLWRQIQRGEEFSRIQINLGSRGGEWSKGIENRRDQGEGGSSIKGV